MPKQYRQNGYIALISLLIIGVIVLVATLSLTFISLGQRTGMISRNRTLSNYYLANACANQALVRLQEDSAYSGNETVNIGDASCQIETILGSGNTGRTIITSSQTASQQKKIKVVIDQLRPVTIINFWGETY